MAYVALPFSSVRGHHVAAAVHAFLLGLHEGQVRRFDLKVDTLFAGGSCVDNDSCVACAPVRCDAM